MLKHEQLLFSVSNKHSPNSGEPTHFNADIPGRYYGYFENEHGEQMVFVYDRNTRIGQLWAGDYSWQKPVKVVDGLSPELMLSDAEETWLQACWNAATTFEDK